MLPRPCRDLVADRDGLGALPSGDPLLGSLVIQDSTFLRLSLRLAHWLPTLRRPDGSGVRVQVWLHPRLDLPEVVQVTSIKVNDCQSWDRTVLGDPDRLAALAGQTMVVDLGYYSHERFTRLLAAGVHLVTRRHPQATVTVEDTGIGIPEADQPHVFDRFYRVEARPAEAAGTGLGLSIVKRVAELHGGAVDLRSLPGKGTVVRLRLPLGRAGQGEPARAIPPAGRRDAA